MSTATTSRWSFAHPVLTTFAAPSGGWLTTEELLRRIPRLAPEDLDDLVKMGIVESYPQAGQRLYRYVG